MFKLFPLALTKFQVRLRTRLGMGGSLVIYWWKIVLRIRSAREQILACNLNVGLNLPPGANLKKEVGASLLWLNNFDFDCNRLL